MMAASLALSTLLILALVCSDSSGDSSPESPSGAPGDERSPAARDPEHDDGDAAMRTLRRARYFVGGTIGFGAEATRAFEAFRRLEERGDPDPFLALLRSKSPVARLYGLQGLVDLDYRGDRRPLLALLDDEEEVHTFFNCVHARSVVAIEAFQRLEQLLSPKEVDAVCADIFREAIAGDRESVKVRLALYRSAKHPTKESLGYLLHRNLDERGGAALLADAEPPSEELLEARVRAVRVALERELPELRLLALRVAVDIHPEYFFETILSRCADDDPDISSAALEALGVLARKRLTSRHPADGIARWVLDVDRVARSAIGIARSALEWTKKQRVAATGVLLAVADALAARDSPAPLPPNAPTEPTAPPVEELLATALATAIDREPLRSLELVMALARLENGGEQIERIWLGDLGRLDPRALPAMVPALEEPPRRERVVERALELASDEESPRKLRLYAVRMLGYLRESSALPLLESLTANENARLVGEAKKAIERIVAPEDGGGAATPRGNEKRGDEVPDSTESPCVEPPHGVPEVRHREDR